MCISERVCHDGTRTARSARVVTFVLGTAFVLAEPAVAQEPDAAHPHRLSVAEAVHLAEGGAEQVRIARAGVRRAQGDQRLALSARLPQLTGSLAYTRTLDSQFRGAFSADTGSSPFGGADFSSLGFGSVNTYNLGLSLSWRLFDGGALAARGRSADAERTTAGIALDAARAQLVLDVTSAYYDAQLAQRMVDIAEATLAQAEATLKQTVAQEQEGNQSEFEVLRARVDRDNRRPEVIQRRSARDVAFFRLKQLLDLPLDQPLELTDALEDLAATDTGSVAPSPEGRERAPVRQAEAGIDAMEGQVDQARAERFPGVSLTSAYGRVAYPRDGTPAWSQFRTNWTVGMSLDLPLFTGGRIGADAMTAEAGLDEARARLDQVREQAELDTYQAGAQLRSARAAWEASTGTVEEAQRAYEIAEIRFREGLSTQLELSDARLLLEQARGNRAQAARDLHVAATRMRLLPDLPLSGAGAGTGSATAAMQSTGRSGGQAGAGGGGSGATSGTASAPAAGSSPGGGRPGGTGR